METITQEKLADFRRMLSEARRIAIVSHMHPDGDAVGSSTAMLHWLESNYDAEVSVVLPDPFPDFLDFLDDENIIIASRDFSAAESAIASADLLICLDFNVFSRTGKLEQALRDSTARKVLTDHHLNPSVEDFDLVFSETAISSASELLYWVLLGLESSDDAASLPAASALSLMTGMTTDTNNFANSVYPGTLRMASSLLAAGVDRDSILEKLYNRYPEHRYRALGYILGDLMKITPDGVAYFVLRKADRDRFNLQDGDTEGFVNMPLGIDRVKLSIFLKEDEGYFRVSIRSMRGVSANRLARESFNGGGHECAAGGRLYFPADISCPDEAEEYILKTAARFMCETAPEK